MITFSTYYSRTARPEDEVAVSGRVRPARAQAQPVGLDDDAEGAVLPRVHHAADVLDETTHLQ